MFYVYKKKLSDYQLVGSYADLEQAKAKAKSVRGLIRRGGYDGQIIHDYRS